MDCLDIPPSVQEKIIQHSKDEEQQRHECIHYYLKSSPFALWGWRYLGGKLHYREEKTALIAAKAYIQRAPGTCGCGMCMYWNVEDAYDCVYTLYCHSKSMPAVMYNNYYCVYSNAIILLNTLMLTTFVHVPTPTHSHVHNIQSHR